MSGTLAAALGGAAGAVALVGIVIIFVHYCVLHNRNISRSSETNSSGPSLQDIQGTRCFALEELNLATKNFSSINLIGNGTFGEVYKGLLQDGMIVAIKRRVVVPSRDFIEEAQNYGDSSNISTLVDHKMGSSFTSEGMREFLRLISWCVNPTGERRPPMNFVVLELDRIHEKEMSLTTIMGEGTTTVTLGSQLFTS